MFSRSRHAVSAGALSRGLQEEEGTAISATKEKHVEATPERESNTIAERRTGTTGNAKL